MTKGLFDRLIAITRNVNDFNVCSLKQAGESRPYNLVVVRHNDSNTHFDTPLFGCLNFENAGDLAPGIRGKTPQKTF